MDVQTTTVSGDIMSNSSKCVTEKVTTEISVPEPLLYIHSAMLQKMVASS